MVLPSGVDREKSGALVPRSRIVEGVSAMGSLLIESLVPGEFYKRNVAHYRPAHTLGVLITVICDLCSIEEHSMLSAFFASAARSTSRQSAFRRIVVVHILVLASTWMVIRLLGDGGSAEMLDR